MRKQKARLLMVSWYGYRWLGPGFEAGVNCSAVIETSRGHTLGRVIRQGSPEPDTGLPDPVGNPQRRLSRAPCRWTGNPTRPNKRPYRC